MMNPLPFPPTYSQQVIRHASSGYPLTTEYIFTNETSRDHFYQSRTELPSLEHPNIHRILAVDISSEGRLFTVSVHSEDVEWTLQRVCLEKWRLGEEWSGAEVGVLVDNVLAGLQFARERGFSAVDLQWTNIAVTDDGYKLMALSKNSGRAVLGDAGQKTKELGHIQPEAQSKEEKDVEKEQIYALGLISLFLLSPKNQGIFATATDLRPHVEALSIAEDLKQLLLAMLHPDPTQRPTAEQLQTSGTHAIESISDHLLTTLCDAVNCKNWDGVQADLSQLFALGEVKAKFTFPCSVCQSPISLQPEPAGVIHSCPQHMICKMSCLLSAHEKCPDSKDCPCCVLRAPPVRRIRIRPREPQSEEPQQRQCATCKRAFLADSTEKWRLDYMGSAEYAKSESVCSLQCMRKPPASVPAVLPRETVPEEWLSPLRKEIGLWNKLLKTVEYMLAENAVKDPGKQEAMQEDVNFVLSSIQENILTKTSGFSCHLCLAELSSRLNEGRWLICGESAVFICSQECFARHLQVDVNSRRHTDHVCPTCGCAVRGIDLAKTLETYLNLCSSCEEVADTELSCRHHQCRACYESARECKECVKSSAALLGSIFMLGSMGYGD